MIRKWISVFLLLAVLTTGLTGCGMELARGIIREYEDNKEGIKSEIYELKEALKSEIREWWDFANEFSADEEEDNGVVE